ncbi:hypothetical protein PYCCODRAFT_1439530 [Trametes coccinea BRFM310]|uniref:Uncharacterized protein n=1 Tax=Trametes coccinea (strain BRFM310) TaxID=1353009 RepID=A0A1Y2IAQ3_TRAC3|nr:hypothetical protein PYCCODRAFT_1439530 [Trametes coccinea BRFM310]
MHPAEGSIVVVPNTLPTRTVVSSSPNRCRVNVQSSTFREEVLMDVDSGCEGSGEYETDDDASPPQPSSSRPLLLNNDGSFAWRHWRLVASNQASKVGSIVPCSWMSSCPVIPGIIEPTNFDRVTRLSLHLDGERSSHMHTLYSMHSNADMGDFPNQATKQHIVALCGQLGDRLEGLSLTMCMPELMVPRVPTFVYDIVKRCQRLVSLGIEDTCCEAFKRLEPPQIFYILTVVHNEGLREDAEPGLSPELRGATEASESSLDSNLHTLVISKRSFTPWQPFCEKMGLDTIYESLDVVHRDKSRPYEVTQRDADPNGCKSNEALRLAVSMLDTLPSLRRACVSLDKGGLDLCMLQEPGEDCDFTPIRAAHAYLEGA